MELVRHGIESLALLLNVDYQKEEIMKAIEKALNDPGFSEDFYSFLSTGIIRNTEELIIKELEIIDLNVAINPKVFHEFDYGELQ